MYLQKTLRQSILWDWETLNGRWPQRCRNVLPCCGLKFSQWKELGRNWRPSKEVKTTGRPAGTVASQVDSKGMASSSVWQHRSDSLCPPVLPCWGTAVGPARPWDEGASQENCWAHGNSKGSAQQSGPKSGKGLQNDPSLMVITKSKQVTSASPSQFAPSQERVCNKTSLHTSTLTCPAAKCLWGRSSKNVKAYPEPQLERDMTEPCPTSRRWEPICYIICF